MHFHQSPLAGLGIRSRMLYNMKERLMLYTATGNPLQYSVFALSSSTSLGTVHDQVCHIHQQLAAYYLLQLFLQHQISMQVTQLQAELTTKMDTYGPAQNQSRELPYL